MGKMVNPQAPCSLWPIETPGSAGSPAPITFQPGATRWTQYRSEGNLDDAVRVVGHDRGARERAARPRSPSCCSPGLRPRPTQACAVGGSDAIWRRSRSHFARVIPVRGLDVLGQEPDRGARRLIEPEQTSPGTGPGQVPASGSRRGRPGCRLRISLARSRPRTWTRRAYCTSWITLRNRPLWRETTTSGVHRPGLIPRIRNSIGRRLRLPLGQRDVGVDPLNERADDLDRRGDDSGSARSPCRPGTSAAAPQIMRGKALGPWISAMVPVAWRRHSSSWKRRSRATLKPCAKKRSCSFRA